MVTIHVQVGLEIRYICVQCDQDMKLEKQTAPTQPPMLRCPQCGHKVKMMMGQAGPALPGLERRMPAFRPQPKA